MSLPKDPFILLSFVNTKLRDEFPSLEKLCENIEESKEYIIKPPFIALRQ